MTWMLGILGWVWFALGLWWFMRPQGIRKRLERDFRKKLRTLLIITLLAVAGVLFSSGRELGGIAGWLVPIAGVIVCLKALLLVRGKLCDTVLDWWSDRSDRVYRGSAACLAIAGLLLQWATSRANG